MSNREDYIQFVSEQNDEGHEYDRLTVEFVYDQGNERADFHVFDENGKELHWPRTDLFRDPNMTYSDAIRSLRDELRIYFFGK